MMHWTTKKTYAVAVGALFLLLMFAQYACACREARGKVSASSDAQQQLLLDDHACCRDEPICSTNANSAGDVHDNCCCSEKVQQDVAVERHDSFGNSVNEHAIKPVFAICLIEQFAIQADLPDLPRGPPDRVSEIPLYILWRSLIV